VSKADDSPLPGWAALYDEAACGLLLTDPDGTIRLANRTFCRALGFESELLVGKRRFQELLSMGGRIFHQTHWAPLLHIQGSVAEVKLDLVHRDGHQIPMVMNAVRRAHGARQFHELSLFVAEDRNTYERELMRARKRAEQLMDEHRRAHEAQALAEARLRTALEAGALYVWEVDPATGERSFDPGVALLLGRGAPGHVALEDYRDAVEPDDLAAAVQAFTRMLESPDRTYRATYRLNGDDGVQRTVLATARPVLHANGTVRRIVGVLQDITELSEQRAAAEDRALFAEQMVGIVSHDLRNPLSTIRMGTQVMEMAGLAPNQVQVMGNIQRAVARSQRLISDLLDFTIARIGQGLTVDVQPIHLHALVSAHVDELAMAHPSHRIEHRRQGGGSAVGDPDRLFQLIDNLVSNAIAYGSAAAPITIASAIADDGYSIAVHNRGPAIPAALQPTLFQPMVRGTDAGSVSRSVGLGLFIVSEIAKAHGGEVRVDSTDAGGTTFTVLIPRSD
jgi:sigma-B regulation protein RsbU (phosphoserine phosphatase)